MKRHKTRPHIPDIAEAPTFGSLEHQIGRLGVVLTVCFFFSALALSYWGVLRAPTLQARDDNPRRIEEERRIRRGNILDRQGRALARSEPGPHGTWIRSYPFPDAAPVVGYASIDHGTGGVERAYDGQIRGGRYLDALERTVADVVHLHSAGVPVTLTLDLDVQEAAGRALGGRTGAVVVLDVANGDILAMVSKPTFDPNTLEADWPELQFSPNKPMLNRAAQGLYPPGLVFETITLVAAMEEGLAEPTQVFTDELGVVLSVDPPISCPSDPPKDKFTLTEAYTWPCSVLFARLGLEMGGEQLADYATKLGIGRPVDLSLDVSTGQLLERGIWSKLLAARTAMGQGEVLVTPLEMAVVMGTLANDGVRPVPRLVLSVGEEKVPAAGEPQQVLDPKIARQVQAILVQSFQVGRGEAALPQADLAGRAGEAESGLPGAPLHAWFIGFAPADEPRYAIAVIVEHGEDGWKVAAPIASRVLASIKDEKQ